MLQSRRVFTISLGVLVLVGFILTSLIGYFVALQSAREQLQHHTLPLTSDNIYSDIQRDLLPSILISSMMANDTFVIDWVTAGELNPQAIQRYLAHIQEKYHTNTAFFVSEATRHYYHSSGILKQVSEDDPADKWYFDARAAEDVEYTINIDWDTADSTRLGIFANFRVLDEQGNLIAVTGVGLSMDSVSALFDNYQTRFDREVYFVDETGQITIRGNDGMATYATLRDKIQSQNIVDRVLTQESASIRYSSSLGERYLQSRFVDEFQWYLVVEQIDHPLLRKLQSALWLNLTLAFVISTVILLIAHRVLSNYQERLEVMATIDKLTGATSRQIFDMLFERTRKTADRFNESVSLISFDIDHFKRINDSYGHAFGDEILKKVVSLTQSLIRDTDTICRWGGEEFLILLPNCHLQDAVGIAEKIRTVLAEYPFNYRQHTVTVTLSAGVTEYRHDESMAQILERCDQALYQAKRLGRNQIQSI